MALPWYFFSACSKASWMLSFGKITYNSERRDFQPPESQQSVLYLTCGSDVSMSCSIAALLRLSSPPSTYRSNISSGTCVAASMTAQDTARSFKQQILHGTADMTYLASAAPESRNFSDLPE